MLNLHFKKEVIVNLWKTKQKKDENLRYLQRQRSYVVVYANDNVFLVYIPENEALLKTLHVNLSRSIFKPIQVNTYCKVKSNEKA